ncbi:MAG: WD40/YVTN/BNR-like repeat-containing protein, partial [Acetobacteraceae bacterium]
MRQSRRLLLPLLILLLLAPAYAAAPAPKTDPYLAALKWRLIGPFRGGRSVAVAGVASAEQTFYFGATGGGLWKTTDGGISWHNVSDKFFKTAPVGALAVAASDPNVIYAGMGESFMRGDMITGDGMYKSTDAGKTWQHSGLENTHVISEIAVDPRDANTVYVAALGHVFGPNPERGIFKSTDGGQTWKQVLYVNDETGGADISIDAHNPRILFASMWQAYRRPWTFSSGGPGSGLYKSTDGGETWTNISKHPGLPTGILGKIGVSVSGADPNRIYAIIEAQEGGVFRSDDDGATWQRLFHGPELTQRAWYYMRIYADPRNADVVYAPEVDGLFKSVDGGASFTPLDTPHGDNHVLWINPEYPQIMVEGNDGGATVSYDGGKSWSSEDNQPTAQIYHATVDNEFPFHIYGAQQDNSSIDIANRGEGGGIGLRDWQP